MKLQYLLRARLRCSAAGDAQSVSSSIRTSRSAARPPVDRGRPPVLILAGELTNRLHPAWSTWSRTGQAGRGQHEHCPGAVTWNWSNRNRANSTLRCGRRHPRGPRNHLHLIFLWFGSWKNGESTYTPLWVKKNQKQYPLFLPESGQANHLPSVFKEANWKADANAFAALMRHIREVDGTPTP